MKINWPWTRKPVELVARFPVAFWYFEPKPDITAFELAQIVAERVRPFPSHKLPSMLLDGYTTDMSYVPRHPRHYRSEQHMMTDGDLAP